MTNDSDLILLPLLIIDTDSEEIKVITKKAAGDKCPVCWKISKKPCSRHKI